MTKIIKKYNQVIIGLVFLFYFLYTLSNAIEISQDVIYATLLIVIIYFLTVFEFFYFYNKYGRPRLQDWLRISFFLILILNYMKIVNNFFIEKNFKVGTISLSLDNSIYVMFIIFIVLIFLDIAYLLYKIFTKNNNYNNNSKYFFIINKKNLVSYLLIFTTVFQSYLLVSGINSFGNTNQDNSGILSLIRMLSGYLTPFPLIISAYIIFIENYRERKFLSIFYISLSVQILNGFLSGMKENILEPILYVIIVYLVSGKKISKKLTVSGILIIIFLYPINSTYRNVITNPHLRTNSNLINFVITFKIISKQSISETLFGGVESYSERTSMFPFLLYAIDYEKNWDYYKDMTRYITLPINWAIPRVIWADKPKADTGAILYEKITGKKSLTAVTPTSIGWAYFEGGILYLILIFIIVGLVLEYIDNRNLKNPLALVFYIILFQACLKPEWDPYFLISSLIPMIIIYLLLIKIIGVRRISIEN